MEQFNLYTSAGTDERLNQTARLTQLRHCSPLAQIGKSNNGSQNQSPLNKDSTKYSFISWHKKIQPCSKVQSSTSQIRRKPSISSTTTKFSTDTRGGYWNKVATDIIRNYYFLFNVCCLCFVHVLHFRK